MSGFKGTSERSICFPDGNINDRRSLLSLKFNKRPSPVEGAACLRHCLPEDGTDKVRMSVLVKMNIQSE